MKKIILFDPKALKDFNKLNILVKEAFEHSFNILSEDGKLDEPEAKKIDKNLYEVRIKVKTQWRAFYAYVQNKHIIILHIFQKKSQKTPKNELKTANKRLTFYN